jgi:chemotaxis family two-component system sensor kinase Cph1
VDSLDINLKEAGIELRIPRRLPTVRADRARVGEIFYNLIVNAMKYNDKERKWIEVGFLDTEEGHPPVFYVRDNGIGIQAKHFDSVFRIFKRLHGRDKYGGGTGAGLTIVKKIIERHSGKIWVESTYGEGTTFYFTLGEDKGDVLGEYAQSADFARRG